MDGVIGRNRRLEESDTPKLPYLQAICKESFRKHPSTPLNLPRISTKACEVNGYYIPKNTKLLVNIWAIGRDPDVWEHPLEFNPDRFMTTKGAKTDPRGNDFELIPFGAGRRICAGVRMGVAPVLHMFGSLIHSFDWSLPEGSTPDMGETFGIPMQKTLPVAAMREKRTPNSIGIHKAMGNWASWVQLRPKAGATAKLVGIDGVVRLVEAPATAAEVMMEFLGRVVASADVVERTRRADAMRADEELRPGEVYLLLPVGRVGSRLSDRQMEVLLDAGHRPRRGREEAAYGGGTQVFPEVAGWEEGKAAGLEGDVTGYPGKRVGGCGQWRPVLDTIHESESD
ncbi:unnamed protein product [Musa textilis]